MIRGFVRILLFGVLIYFSFGTKLLAQGGGGGGTVSPVALERITPPTPEAASLGKYGSFPVGLFTGTPNVNIDLYKLTARRVSLPITLNYSSNGLKVDEMPSKVGMSWVLHAGGAITRTVYDKPDDTYGRAGAPPSTDFSSTTSTDLTLPAWLEQIDAQHLDTQLDEFNYSFAGYSGKFILGPNNVPVSIPYSNLKIEFSPMRITTPDGIQYYFGENGATESSLIGSGSCSRDDSHGAKTAWYLTRIVNSNDPSDNITLTYIIGGYTYTANQNHTITYWNSSNNCTGAADEFDPCGCGPTPCIYGGNGSPNLAVDNFCSNVQIVSLPYISEIISSTYGKIKFIYNTSYSSMTNPIPIDRILTTIQIFQNNDGTNLLRSFNLNYTFVVPVSSGKITSLDNISTYSPDTHSSRPFLTTIQENDSSSKLIKTHSFEYNDINNLTARVSSSQDYWGYYNGKSNSTSFIPNVGGSLPTSKIADRNPDYSYASKGILTKVNFPTGGNVQFIYEGNSPTQTIPTSSPATTVPLAYAGAGMRVKQQIIYDPISQQSTTTNYDYSGMIIPYTPNYSNNLYYQYEQYLWNPGSNACSAGATPCAPMAHCSYFQYSSNSTINTNGRGGSPVYYTAVTERIGDNLVLGGTEHKYTFFVDDNPILYRGNFIPNTSLPSSSWKNGLETNRNIFKMVSGNKVYLQKTINTYVDDPGINNVFTQYVTKRSGVSATTSPSHPDNCFVNQVFNLRMNVFDVISFATTQKWTYLSSKIDTNYDQNGNNPVAITTNYFYDNAAHAMLTRTQTTGSKGEVLQTTDRYPGDESSILNLSTSELDAISKLKTQYRVATLLEKEQTNNGNLVSRSRTGFKDWGINFILPETQKLQVANNPMETRINDNAYDPDGNIQEAQKANDKRQSYIWGYKNTYPIASSANAANNYRLVPSAATTTSTLNLAPGQFGQQQLTFTTYYTGSITVSIQSGSYLGSGGTITVSGQFTLIGPTSSQGGNVCISSSNGVCTSPSSVTFTNMPVGNYILQFTALSNNATSNVPIQTSYQGVQYTPTGITEIFFEGFEENVSAINGVAHTGTKYLNGNYTVPFIMPNGRAYTIQWWSLAGSWIFHQQSYTNSMVLTGPVDDVRVFPSDAQISTYTYAPLIGTTSETDPAGKTIFYEYDAFQRLKNIKDFQGNIVKNFQYNYVNSCGSNCFILPMQTFNGSNTLSYPVGVFNVNESLVGYASNQAQYISLWNSNPSNQSIGVLAAGADSMRFNLTVNSGVNFTSRIIGCRYYQYDFNSVTLDCISNANGSYVDFGDGTSMRMGNSIYDRSPVTLAPNTSQTFVPEYGFAAFWGSGPGIQGYVHSYPNSNSKTITIFHNDDNSDPTIWHAAYGDISFYLSNVRGNFPQNMQFLDPVWSYVPSAQTVTNITNWSSITTIGFFYDGVHPSYVQDFMKYNLNLHKIHMSDTFNIKRLKSDWNTYFLKLDTVICEFGNTWNRENLSALTNLKYFSVAAPSGAPMTAADVDNIINQVAAGAGQYISNGKLIFPYPGRTSASDNSLNYLKSKGWYVDNL
ncbi:MAG: hypothetical protein JST75_09360 [Bacteroidetes bacterium]|nr:hypothetical protein [Bacteroidota bacterium]